MSKFVEVKTSDLEGEALNWAVAVATGAAELKITDSGSVCCIYEMPCGSGCWTGYYEPSTDWSHGGPLISRYLMDFSCDHPETIGAALCDENGMYLNDHMACGPTHLIAACLALVAYKTGEWVCIPKELLP